MTERKAAGRGSEPALHRKSSAESAPAHPILAIQRIAGNEAVQRLLRYTDLQARLHISQPGDKYEQEADRTADKVMRAESHERPVISRLTEAPQAMHPDAVQRSSRNPLREHPTASVAHEASRSSLRENPDSGPHFEPSRSSLREHPQCCDLVQRAEAEGTMAKHATGRVHSSGGFEGRLEASKGAGQPLQPHTRAFFESRFGADFTGVRVHTGPEADRLNRDVYAKAFTSGNHIYFASGHHNPETSSGKTLLAHELTHVVQQGKAGPIQRDTLHRKDAGHACQQGPHPCPACQQELHRKATAEGTPTSILDAEQKIQSRGGSAQPLARSTRDFMDARLGEDFGDARVHSDSGGAPLARQLSAEAFTTGQDICFAQERYQPDTANGRTLLARELTHTVQQGATPAQVSRKGGDPPAAPPVDAQSVKDAADIIIDALKGITTAWGSERIVKQFRGKSGPYIQALMDEIKARAKDNDETPQGMITWLLGDLTADDRGELRRILIKVRVLKDLGPILIEELVTDLGGVFGGGAKTLDVLSQFIGAALDNMLGQLATATKKDVDALPDYLFDKLDRVSAEKLRRHFFDSGGQLAGKAAAYYTASRVHKQVSGFFGLVSHSESTIVVSLFKSVPAELLPTFQARLDILFQASDGQKAEEMLMRRLDQSDYELLQQLPGVTLSQFKPEFAGSGIGSKARWGLTLAQWIVCGAVGVVTGLIAAIWDIVKGLWDIVKAAYHLVGSVIYLISGFSFGRDHWVAVRDFFVSLGKMFAHPISTFNKMWEDLALEFQTIEGPFADCKRAEFVVRKVIGVVANVALIFLAGYGIAKAAVSVVVEVAELAQKVGLLKALGQTLAKAGRAIVKFVPAKAGELAKVGRLFLRPVELLIKVKRQLNGLLLAVDKKGVFAYFRGKGRTLLANERQFWVNKRDRWRSRGLKTAEKQAASEDKLAQVQEGMEKDQVPAEPEKELQDVENNTNQANKEANDLESEMKSEPETGKPTPLEGKGALRDKYQPLLAETDPALDNIKAKLDAADAIPESDPVAKAKAEAEAAADLANIQKVKDWEKASKISGDVSDLKSRLGSSDSGTRLGAKAELTELEGQIARGETPEVRGGKKGPDQPDYEVKARTEPFTGDKNAQNWFNDRIKAANDQFKGAGRQGRVVINVGDNATIGGKPIDAKVASGLVKEALSKGARGTNVKQIVVKDGSGRIIYQGLGE